ncbi:putative cleavage and polyadenylation specificity factor subunit 2 [Triangularia verruculosa]|uniref:Cleavage and polyadenylation specificity factor subunit 2 n=1 Tax=Triangularia verruculosa TaxID=2587418 RepID=A0AAN7AYU5_9PEZI|nr:putative cleavage and polyadenylation specificity factor subunit 2 [Triangularia verruculosa]
MFSFCPLQGALSESTASQSLLELDGGVKILVDVGWDETFDVDKLKELEKQVPTLSFILLTHATVAHVGAYAHCCKHIPLFSTIPAYATRPVIDLGRTLTQDLYASTPLAATTIPTSSLAEVAYASSQAPSLNPNLLLQPPSPEEITRYFASIQAVQYSQPQQPRSSPFSPDITNLTVTAYNSGRTLGGAIWHIQHGLESIVYAVDWNQGKENVFSGAAWLSGGHGGGGSTEVIEQLRKPTALVCSSRTPDTTLSRAKRDEQLLESIKLCIGRGGTVLIPADSSARILELSYLLEHAWRNEVDNNNETFRNAQLYLAGHSIGSTIKHARSLFEWMDDKIVREFEAAAGGKEHNDRGRGQRGGHHHDHKVAGPFDFKHLRLLERKGQVSWVLKQALEDPEPKGRVILATDSSLEWGFSKEVLKSIAGDARNLVLLTEKPALNETKPSIARTLWEWWKERKDGVATEQTSGGDTFEQVYAGGRELEIADASKQALEGNDLSVYQQWLATKQQLQATSHGGSGMTWEAWTDLNDALSDTSSESEESETEQQGKALNISANIKQASRKKVVLNDEDLGVNILIKKRGVYDYEVRGKKGREAMFPAVAQRRRHDEFGDLIRPEDYLRAEEREVADSQETDPAKAKQEDNLGKKRSLIAVNAANKGTANNKRQQPPNRALSDEPDDASTSHGQGHQTEEVDELSSDEDTTTPILGPAKLVITTRRIPVNLRIAFVDFSGLHDKRSLHMLIPLIQPRRLVLVSGNEEESLALAADCKKLLSAQLAANSSNENATVDVFTPEVGAVVNASVDTNAWVVKLSEHLVKRLKWQDVNGLGIATITGVLLPGGEFIPSSTEEEQNKRLKTEEGGSPASSTALTVSSNAKPRTLPTLDLVPQTVLSTTVKAASQPLHVGDLRLADLRRAMLSGGHKAEFRGEGTLLIDETVAVRKSAAGRIEVESVALPGTFYAVRQKIYDVLAVVPGA